MGVRVLRRRSVAEVYDHEGRHKGLFTIFTFP